VRLPSASLLLPRCTNFPDLLILLPDTRREEYDHALLFAPTCGENLPDELCSRFCDCGQQFSRLGNLPSAFNLSTSAANSVGPIFGSLIRFLAKSRLSILPPSGSPLLFPKHFRYTSSRHTYRRAMPVLASWRVP
jgi:hypothetical protein